MLIQFSVKNYRSIKDEQTLSLVRGSGDELPSSNSFDIDSVKSISLLRSAVVYGANAAGKSNVIRALITMENIVLGSASKSQKGDSISVVPFLLDKETSKRPSEFQIVFINDGVHYQYGFSATRERIVDEWLIAFPEGRPQRWFARSFDEKAKKSVFEFGGKLGGAKSVWEDATRDNALFLSTAVQLNSEQLAPVFDWFQDKLRVSGSGGWGAGYTASCCEKPEIKNRIIELLKAADFDICDVKVEKEKFSLDKMSDELRDIANDFFLEKLKGEEWLEISTIHETSDGDVVEFDLEEESDGTQKFFSFVGPWLDVLDNGYVMAIDELHDNLHPKLVRYLVDLFHSSETNPKNAQLVFTTHETSILNQDVFRRDQIWFCDKPSDQATHLYPLTDFSPRKGRENLELSYLGGRYGAVPFIRDREFCAPKDLVSGNG